MEDPPATSFAPPIVPYGADETVFVVIENPAHPAAPRARSSAAISRRLLPISWPDKFGDPIRVLAFNTLEHWSKDFSADVAREIKSRCDMDGVPVPDHLRISSRLGARTSLPGSPRLR